MTGTSLDAIDVVLVEVRGRGVDLGACVLDVASTQLGDLAHPLRALASGGRLSAMEVTSVAHDFGVAIAEAVARVAGGAIDLCAVHGQTVHHAPPLSWQLLSPWPIAQRMGCDVVYDLRGSDLAAGGQGAPITPLADAVLFSCTDEDRVIINLGGFCNATVLPAGDRDGARGADICACNQVLDAVARRALGTAHDVGGKRALQGSIDENARDALATLLGGQARAGRSLGTGDEASDWIGAHSAALAPDDLAATAASGVGRTIRAWIDDRAPGARVFLAGGGVRNAALVRAIGADNSTEALGVSPDAREGAAMAVLGALAQDRTPITLQRVTGRGDAMLVDGAWVFAKARS